MSVIPGGIRFTGFVAPSDSADTYPVIDPIYGLGGYREVANSTVRDAISSARRREGMMVYVQDTSTFYYLKNGIANANWTEVTFGTVNFPITVGQGGTGLISISAGRIPFGNNTTTLNTSGSLTWDSTNNQLLSPTFLLTQKTLTTIQQGRLEFDGTSLYFSPSNSQRSTVLLSTIPNGVNITLGTSSGTQIGTSPTQKLSFFGAPTTSQRGPYNITYAQILRTINARDYDMDQLIDLVCSLIIDLQALGLIG
jgi:hypothetical protein